MHFRWGVALVGEFSSQHFSPLRGTPFQVQGVYREMVLRRGHGYEEGGCVALILPLSNIFVKNILYKRIITKFFWDYCLNSRVCNYGKRTVIRLLWTVIKCFIFIFRFKCE